MTIDYPSGRALDFWSPIPAEPRFRYALGRLNHPRRQPPPSKNTRNETQCDSKKIADPWGFNGFLCPETGQLCARGCATDGGL